MDTNPISFLLHKNIEHKCVIINLWTDSNRMIDTLGATKDCCHLHVSNQRCGTCGSYVGYFGHEKDPLLFFKHVDLLAMSFSLRSEDVFIITHRMFPEDYQLHAFGIMSFGYKSFTNRKVYTVYDAVNVSTKAKTHPTPHPYYIIHYSKNPDSFWKNKFVYSKDLDLLALSNSTDTLLVNPTRADLRYYHSGFTFFVPNSSILVLLESAHKRDPVKLLKV